MTVATETSHSQEWRTVRFEVLERIESLPSLSNVVVEFIQLVRKDFYTAKEFETVISKDQALVARLLRLANSGIYGRRRSVHSIPEAVVLIGLESIKNIVFAVSAENIVKGDLNKYDYDPATGFWRHSLAVGLAARSLAETATEVDLHAEEAFIAGLLHDIGKLIIDDFLDPEREPGPVTRAEESAAVGLDHAELAEYILTQWNLPPAINRAVLCHHDDPADPEADPGGLVIGLAQVFCQAWNVGQTTSMDLSQEVDLAGHTLLLERLGLPEETVPQIVWNVRQHLSDLDTLFAEG